EKSILIIDDELSILESLHMFLSEKGYDVKTAVCASEGMEKAERLRPDTIILDIRLPDADGLGLLTELKKRTAETGVIVITAFHDMDTTVTAIKRGATEYITKPIDVDELEKAVSRAMKVTSVMKARKASPEIAAYHKGKIVGNSKDMKEVFKVIGALSENRVTVLIEGETGTGKELIAKAIHCNGPYKDHPFLVINCSAIVPTLLESELFGHEKGSFTGAFRQKKGKFELAGEGTIFLDEVGEIPMELQSKLLRFLQEKEFERVGGEKAFYSNARVIAATNRDLWQMVRQNAFREDLYYRLSVATIKVPPLRARRGDIPLLVTYLLRKINSELHRNIKTVEENVVHKLMDYDWPGNVRELENVLTRAAINTQGNVIFEEFVTPLLSKTKESAEPPPGTGAARSLAAVERQHIIQVLNDTEGHLGKTCEVLGISRPTLRQKLKEYSIADRPGQNG
ncbi:MAG: sigma-54 dependent transcriptional regulator, partial [Syntrophales bacterium LBB04]|nr:sigma-54 dependent transcriptional regulator [Syntrophales bacterium LBB04]